MRTYRVWLLSKMDEGHCALWLDVTIPDHCNKEEFNQIVAQTLQRQKQLDRILTKAIVHKVMEIEEIKWAERTKEEWIKSLLSLLVRS